MYKVINILKGKGTIIFTIMLAELNNILSIKDKNTYKYSLDLFVRYISL